MKIFVFFDLDKSDCYKADDLQNIRSFVDKNFTVKIEWWKLGTGAKVVFSECGTYSIETCKDDLKRIHLFQTIAVAGATGKQN